ncbi:hypothetical protein GCM10027449_10810 [Sinomonas notoginsengisoli]|uniref:hypothetical protein n=1 Tax=Sinomonas notoginsengisoli TaxID=1457311 RepID=UPI001F171BAE|nr:hypothetical protein [Sinomonas notoginsengisoli]
MTRPPEHHRSAFDAAPLLTLTDSDRAPLTGRRSVLRTWGRTRWGTAAAAALLAAAALVFANGAFDGASVAAALGASVLVVAGSASLGLLIGSFVSAPIGAEATVCDIRGPLFGLMGLMLATSQSRSSLLVQMFAGLPLDAIRFAVQPAVGVAAVALMVAALAGRLRLERSALSDPARAEACATCTALFPGRR